MDVRFPEPERRYRPLRMDSCCDGLGALVFGLALYARSSTSMVSISASSSFVNIGNRLYVTYSGPTGVVDIVDIFDTEGHFMNRFGTGGTLPNPWGVAMAPANFGEFSNAWLVGSFNFGDPAKGPGHISAFDSKGNFLGLLEDTSGAPISVDGLWTLTFGNDQGAGSSSVLYFTAGIQNQHHGLFGSLEACIVPAISGVSASSNALRPPNQP
jgi:uncharacterized protein (TIGR03118 family)